MTPENLHLNFWGVKVSAAVSHLSDHARLAYYFQDYVVVERGIFKSEIKVTFNGNNSKPFFATNASERSLRIEELATGKLQTIDGADGDQSPTPLPPFGMEPMATKIRVLHAAALEPPGKEGKGILIHGESTSGKTTLTVELATRGWKIASDDTCPTTIDRYILPYTRPFGIRENLARRLGLVRIDETYGEFPTFLTPTGLTRAVHPRDLGLPICENPIKWEWTCILVRSSSYSVASLGPFSIQINCNMDQHLDSVVWEIERFVNS